MNLNESQQVELFDPNENYEKEIKGVPFRYPLYNFLRSIRKGLIKEALDETNAQL
jgi:hypothetical protein